VDEFCVGPCVVGFEVGRSDGYDGWVVVGYGGVVGAVDGDIEVRVVEREVSGGLSASGPKKASVDSHCIHIITYGYHQLFLIQDNSSFAGEFKL
jgi:hypothetical protein